MRRSDQLFAWLVGEAVENMRVNGDPSKPIEPHQIPYPLRFRHRAPMRPQDDENKGQEKEEVDVR